MPRQRIALRTRHLTDCFEACAPDARFLEAFGRIRDLFAPLARDHESSRNPDDVSAKDIEAQMLRLYFLATVGTRMQQAASALEKPLLADPTVLEADIGPVVVDEPPKALET